MVVATHKNDIVTYLTKWQMELDMIQRGLNKEYSNRKPTPKIIQAISTQTNDLWIVLSYLDSKLNILENNEPFENKYQEYADAIVFLKVTYIFFRTLLNTLEETIRYFYKKNENIKLPCIFTDSNNNKKRKNKAIIPKDLSIIIEKVYKWFPIVKDRRDKLVHEYETLLITFKQDKKNKINILSHFSTELVDGNKAKNLGNIREYIGFLLCSYQELIDDLLDHFDIKFKDWYGLPGNKNTRVVCCKGEDMLWWWASKYGNYNHPDLKFDKQCLYLFKK